MAAQERINDALARGFRVVWSSEWAGDVLTLRVGLETRKGILTKVWEEKQVVSARQLTSYSSGVGPFLEHLWDGMLCSISRESGVVL